MSFSFVFVLTAINQETLNRHRNRDDRFNMLDVVIDVGPMLIWTERMRDGGNGSENLIYGTFGLWMSLFDNQTKHLVCVAKEKRESLGVTYLITGTASGLQYLRVMSLAVNFILIHTISQIY